VGYFRRRGKINYGKRKMNCRRTIWSRPVRSFITSLILAVAFGAPAADAQSSQTVLGIQRAQFTINGQPTFLLGISYYGGLGADDETWRRDFDKLQACGFNWVRAWATWSAFGGDWAAVDPTTGEPRQPFLASLEKLVAECDRRGVVVDVTLSRGKAGSAPPRLVSHASHARAVRTLLETLKPYRNWYLDLSNERNIGDSRHTSIDELHELRELARQLDGDRLVTASHGGDIASDELPKYLHQAGVDFITPHRPRDPSSPKQTENTTREYLAEMRKLGRVVPVHYQEPFRRGYDKGWEPSADDFLNDLAQARAGGAAGWCFHNGDERGAAEGRPRRSFDLRERPLFEQLDAEEQRFIERRAAQARR
jgi:hypothetical protein